MAQCDTAQDMHPVVQILEKKHVWQNGKIRFGCMAALAALIHQNGRSVISDYSNGRRRSFDALRLRWYLH